MFTHNRVARCNRNSSLNINTHTHETTVVGLSHNNNKTACREEVDLLGDWCTENVKRTKKVAEIDQTAPLDSYQPTVKTNPLS